MDNEQMTMDIGKNNSPSNRLVPELRFSEFDEDWKVNRLDKLAKIERGRFSPRPRNNPIYYGGSIPFVQTGDVVHSNGIIDTYSQTLNQKGLEVSKLFPKGTILITIAANIGYAGILNEDMACPDSLIGITCKKEVLNSFLNILFELHQPKMDYLAVAAAQKNINIEFLKPYKLIVPSFKEQQKIANFLTVIDQRITLLKQKKAALEYYKKGLMQKIFNEEIRFTDKYKKYYQDWKSTRLGSVFKVSAGGDVKKENSRKEKGHKFKYPIYANSLKNKGLYGYSDIFKIDEECITVTGRGALGFANARFERFFPIVRLLVLKPKFKLNSLYFEQVINNLKIYNESTGVPQLTAPQLKTYRIKYSTEIAEQNRIANFLSAIDQKINAIDKQIADSELFKKGLLQKMFV